jgi:hypothetical protein
MMLRKTLYASSVSAFAIFTPLHAAAADAQKVKEALEAAFANYGLSMKAASVEAAGDNIVIKGLQVSTPQATAGDISPPIDVTLESVTETETAFTISQIAAPEGTYPVKDGTWEFGGASIKGLRLTKPGGADPMQGVMLYESMEMQPTRFVAPGGGGDLIRLGLMKVAMSPYTSGQPLNFEMGGDFFVNAIAAAKDDAEAKAVLGLLGMNEVNGKIKATGGWNPADGKIEITEESFDIANVGRLDMKFSFSGYTADFAKSLQELARTNAGQSDAANGMKMMGMLQQLTFNSMSLRFDDAGITSKLLDLASQRMGQPKDAIITQAKGAAPMMVMQLQDADLTMAVSNAVTAYLDNPKSFEIKLAPEAPMPFSLITATGMSTPQALVKQLGLKISANQ